MEIPNGIKWGDDNTLKALADKLRIEIEVIKATHTFSIKSSDDPVNGKILLGLHKEVHYYSLERSE